MLQFNCPDMSCNHCAMQITKAIQSLDPEAVVQVDVTSKKVEVISDADPQRLREVLREAGYPPQ